jgi:hypothetical protein
LWNLSVAEKFESRLRNDPAPGVFYAAWGSILSSPDPAPTRNTIPPLNRGRVVVRALAEQNQLGLSVVGLMKACEEKHKPEMVIALAALDGSSAGDEIGRWFAQIDFFSTHLSALLLDPKIKYGPKGEALKQAALGYIRRASGVPESVGNGVRASQAELVKIEVARTTREIGNAVQKTRPLQKVVQANRVQQAKQPVSALPDPLAKGWRKTSKKRLEGELLRLGRKGR